MSEDFRSLRATPQWQSHLDIVEGLRVETPALQLVVKEVTRIHLQVARRYDAQEPWSPTNRAKVEGLLVLGPSFSTKTHSIATAMAELEPIRLHDGRVLEPNTLLMDAPDYGTMPALARDIIGRLDNATMAREPVPREANRKVMAALCRAKLTMFGLDWIDRILSPDRHSAKGLVTESHLFWAQMMAAQTEPRWSTPVVLAGSSVVADTLSIQDGDPKQRKAREDALSRFNIVRLPSLQMDDTDFMVTTVQTYCRELGLRVVNSLFEDNLAGRLVHASNYSVGTALVLAQEACALAKIRPNSKGLKPSDFADTYAAWSHCSDDSNPFTSPHWHNINTRRIAPRSFDEAKFAASPAPFDH